MIKKVEDITPLRLFDYFYTEIIGLQLNRNHEGGAVAELSKGMPRREKMITMILGSPWAIVLVALESTSRRSCAHLRRRHVTLL